MKKYLIIAYLMHLAIILWGQEHYYYYQGEKQVLDVNMESLTLCVLSHFNQDQIKNYASDIDITLSAYECESEKTWNSTLSQHKEFKFIKVTFNSELNTPRYKKFISDIKNNSSVLSVNPYYQKENHKDIITTSYLFVKLKTEQDVEKLNVICKDRNYEIVEHNKYMPLWYTIRCFDDVVQTASRLYEGGMFAAVEPNFINIIETNCTNDPYIGNQWGISNTGQQGGTASIDIKACQAWQYSTGVGSVVAIIDEGIQLDHPDLINNIYPISYNAEANSSPSILKGSHGTRCAGVIAAIKDNSIGLVGVAPNSNLMSINFGSDDAALIRGFNFASSSNASVISNSWMTLLPNQGLVDAIQNALTSGRNQLGCVVVFSAGNRDRDVEYPANSLSDIICVGGIDRCGARSGTSAAVSNSCDPWPSDVLPASCFGADLDVVAPGTSVVTTDLTDSKGVNSNGTNDLSNPDYTEHFAGTSAAAPHVAGLAALILSINPCLTQKQVSDIIQRSAQKISTFIFDNSNTDRTNGSWNAQAGHGLIDAFDALQLVKTNYIQNTTVSDVKFIANPIGEIIVGNNVDITQSYNTGDVNVSSGGDLALKSSQRIKLTKGFHASAGCRFRAEVLPNFNNCNGWISSKNLLQNEVVMSYNQVENKINTNQENNISIYPNPNRGTFVVTYQKQDNTQITSIKVFDLLGKVLYEEILPSYESINNHEIDLSAILSNGCYFINITEGNHFANTKFIYHDN